VGLVTQQQALTLILLAFAVYFSVLVANALRFWLRARSLRAQAMLIWEPARPRHQVLQIALGVLCLGVAALNSAMGRPFHHVYSQGVMAAYFIVVAPLVARIPNGLFQSGVWGDAGFVPYEKIARMAFLEIPEIALVVVPRGRRGTVRLRVPPEEYGAVRKIIEEKTRAHQVNVEQAILGL
jgi:hypothetical protein